MARYSREHKKKTREKIVDVAAHQFRVHGFDGVGIDDIMAKAGLTRGGFYNHFKSKADLFKAVIDRRYDFNRRMRDRDGETPEELARQAFDVIAGYLGPENRKAVGRGCTMASLSPDIARRPKRIRTLFADRLADLEREFARSLDEPGEPDPRALAAIALCVGGLVLSRAAAPAPVADAIAVAARDEAARLIGADAN